MPPNKLGRRFGAYLNPRDLWGVFSNAVKSRSSREATTYLIATAVNLGVPLLLLPVLTRYLEPGGYAGIIMFQTIISIASALTLFGVGTPLLRTFTVEPQPVQADYLASCIAICSGVSIVMLAVFALFSLEIANLVYLPRRWIVFALVCGIAVTIFQLKQIQLRAARRAAAYGFLLNIQTALNLSISLALVIGLSWGWRGRAIAIILGSLAMAVWSLYSFYRAGQFGKVRKVHLGEAFALGAAGSIHTILATLLTIGDRLLISATHGPEALGIYAVATQLAAGYAILGTAFNMAWAPWVFSRLAVMRTAQDHTTLLHSMAAMCGLIMAGTAVYGVGIMAAFGLLVDSSYAEAKTYFGPLLIGACFQNLYFVFAAAIFHYRRPKILILTSFALLASAVACVLVFSGFFSPLGVAVAVMVLRIIMFATVLVAALYLMHNALRAAIIGPAGSPPPDGDEAKRRE